ncbi:MAG TPA: hypothetical protein VGN33_05180 [Leifsonia sp.]|nr:hypothetical protein [Leifsonia sp.]
MDTSYFLNSALDRVLRLGLERSMIVALACAPQLASAAHNTDPEISTALAMGWDRDVEASERGSLAGELERRPDVDDDVVAATFYDWMDWTLTIAEASAGPLELARQLRAS